MTSDERRVVAARLRMCGQTVKGTKHIFMYLANCVDAPSDDLDGDDIFCLQRNRRVAKKTLEKLADLIDPTCKVDSIEPIEYGEFNETIGYCFNLTCGHSVMRPYEDIPPAYCDECGARVASDDGHE